MGYYVNGYDEFHEIGEAIAAGEQALSSLREAESALDSAGSWGIWDILGGNIITGMIKHSRIDEARSYLEHAKSCLYAFQQEIYDVRGLESLTVDIGGFLTFADFFLDGFIADLIVQSKIDDAKQQVQGAIAMVCHALDILYQRRNAL
ncbi:MAG: hypothetical protein IJI16_06510 [Atopobiaceae bacterium]|nr:hypothetical protein [Atopobiaceae bacterium]MBQ3282645.1 hypothetical protein [Atopobiaceae bacterium]MBQ6411583.1 hypothetical protein [Atopobiaceae bacterium]MBR3384405.1 hypothetical protein [Atopobiaceae bacterium]